LTSFQKKKACLITQAQDEAGINLHRVLLLFCGFFGWLLRCFLSCRHIYLLFLKIKQRKFDSVVQAIPFLHRAVEE
jgi:hypothetical protein